MSTVAANQFEEKARREKVNVIVDFVIKQAISTLDQFSDDSWQNMAAQCGQKKPGEETKRLVIEMLKGKLRG